MTEKHRKFTFALAVAVFILFCALCGYYVGIPMVRLAKEPEMFRQWVDSFGAAGRPATAAWPPHRDVAFLCG